MVAEALVAFVVTPSAWRGQHCSNSNGHQQRAAVSPSSTHDHITFAGSESAARSAPASPLKQRAAQRQPSSLHSSPASKRLTFHSQHSSPAKHAAACSQRSHVDSPVKGQLPSQAPATPAECRTTTAGCLHLIMGPMFAGTPCRYMYSTFPVPAVLSGLLAASITQAMYACWHKCCPLCCVQLCTSCNTRLMQARRLRFWERSQLLNAEDCVWQ